MSGPEFLHCNERAGRERLLALLRAPNVKAVRRGGVILHLFIEERIDALTGADDSKLRRRGGNASTESHDHETPTNPPRCWTLRHPRRRTTRNRR